VLCVRISWRLAAVTAALALSACSAGPAKTGPSAPPRPSSAVPLPQATPASSALTVARGSPGCSTATGHGAQLPASDVTMSRVPGDPFGVAVTANGRWSFVSSPSGSVSVLAISGSGAPRLVRQIPVPQALGVAITPDGRYLLAASLTGAVVIDVARAETGAPHEVLGTLRSPQTRGRRLGGGGGAIEVAVSPDGRFAFASLEYSGEIAVFNLQQALASGFRTTGFVGDIPTGIAPVGMAVSPDGRWLYATSEVEAQRPAHRRGLLGAQGTLSVISLSKAETGPAHSAVATVTAGCSPVRVVTSADGSTVWVTARESDRLLAFSAARLLSDPARSLIASVEVGEAPVGLALVDGGQRIVVADSNRFGFGGAASSLAVVNVAAALAGKPALAGYLRAGGFPRQMALEPDGRTLLVTDFSSGQLEVVRVAGLP
jgi:DNA-binding beta-propeller fold protein YncE